jgi:predicted lipoprotein with Yx(FWY)xxD motif
MSPCSRFVAPFVLVAAGAAAPPAARAQWTADGVPLCAATNVQLSPAIAADGAGGAIVAWRDLRGTTYDIYASRVDASGVVGWTPNGVGVCLAAANQDSPAICSDGSGGAIVAWRDVRGGTYDIYVRRVDASGAPQWTADGVPLCTAAAQQQRPVIAPDGSGGAVVAWDDDRSGASAIYARRVDASGAPLWTANGVKLSPGTGNGASVPAIIPDLAGGAIIAWHDGRGGPYDIYVQRVDAAGVPQWGTDGVALCTNSFDQQEARITTDGAGGAIVTWYDYRGTISDIYVRRVDSAGVPQWTADGVALCTASADQRFPTIAPDGAGGAIVAWRDTRAGSHNDIYARRVDASGSALWTADGQAICTVGADQYQPTIASDGAGGAIISWWDFRGGAAYDIYAQRVDSAGTPQWTVDGLALCTAANSQRSPVIVSDGAGGALVGWEDDRAGAPSTDVYAIRVAASGSPTAVSDLSSGEPLAALRNHPNPFRGATVLRALVPAASALRVTIHDVTGRRVREIGVAQAGPVAEVAFDGRDDRGRQLPSGTYFWRVDASGTPAGKMVIVR